MSGCQAKPDMVLLASDEIEPDPGLPARTVSASTRSAAVALLGALSPEQRKLAAFQMDAPLRKDWHFIPRERKGLSFGDMTNEQKTLLHKLMQTALSDSGYLKATDIIWLESILYETSNQAPFRSPNNYVLQVYGDPANEKAAWAWRLEGHHLSINLTYTPDRIGVTPMFLGTNPAVVQNGPLAGKRVLSEPHVRAVALAKSMTPEQKKMMMLERKPRDVVTGPGREKSLSKPAGIAGSELTLEQQSDLMWLMGNYWGLLEKDHRKRLFDMVIPNSDWTENVHFAWAGPIDADEPFYYRIYTPAFVIEYSCQGKNHVHAVMHDLTDPLQEDLLKKHFEQHEH